MTENGSTSGALTSSEHGATVFSTLVSMSLCVSYQTLLDGGFVRPEDRLAPELKELLLLADSTHITASGTMWYFRKISVPFSKLREWLSNLPRGDYRLIVIEAARPHSVGKDAGTWDTNPWNVRRDYQIAYNDSARKQFHEHALEVHASTGLGDDVKVDPDESRVEVVANGAWVPIKIFVNGDGLNKK